MTIKILVTGGTFDKEYNYVTEELYFKETHIPEMLKLGRSTLDVEIRTIMLIDSLKMTTADRKTILEHCKQSKEERIVITHGTGTMVETAKVLAKGIKNKTIVITGAMIPCRVGSSDGLFNLGSALAWAQCRPHGIYIAMNGRCFDWNNCRKNQKAGIFETLK